MRLLLLLLTALSLTWSSTSSAYAKIGEPCAREVRAPGARAELEGTQGRLLYAQARYLDANTGRFLSLDPVAGALDEPLSTQGWTYANTNPTRFTDPDGRHAEGERRFKACVSDRQDARLALSTQRTLVEDTTTADFAACDHLKAWTEQDVERRFGRIGRNVVQGALSVRETFHLAVRGATENNGRILGQYMAPQETLGLPELKRQQLQMGQRGSDVVQDVAEFVVVDQTEGYLIGKSAIAAIKVAGVAGVAGLKKLGVLVDGVEGLLVGKKPPPSPTVFDDVATAEAKQFGDDVLGTAANAQQRYDVLVGRHGSMPKPRNGMESHHGMQSAGWMQISKNTIRTTHPLFS